jgi:hypothetical protein
MDNTTTLHRTIEFDDGSQDHTLPTEVLLWNDDPIVVLLDSLPEGATVAVIYNDSKYTYRKV